MRIIMILSAVAVPFFVIFVIAYSAVKGVGVYDAFCKGAKEGLELVIKILPYICAMVISIGLLRDSGLMDIFCSALSKPISKLGIPPEILQVFMIRPFSASAALGVLEDIYTNCGVDSLVGFIASTMMGSSETTFYVISLYFSSVGIKKSRYAIPVALICDFVAMLIAVASCSLLLGN